MKYRINRRTGDPGPPRFIAFVFREGGSFKLALVVFQKMKYICDNCSAILNSIQEKVIVRSEIDPSQLQFL